MIPYKEDPERYLKPVEEVIEELHNVIGRRSCRDEDMWIIDKLSKFIGELESDVAQTKLTVKKIEKKKILPDKVWFGESEKDKVLEMLHSKYGISENLNNHKDKIKIERYCTEIPTKVSTGLYKYKFIDNFPKGWYIVDTPYIGYKELGGWTRDMIENYTTERCEEYHLVYLRSPNQLKNYSYVGCCQYKLGAVPLRIPFIDYRVKAGIRNLTLKDIKREFSETEKEEVLKYFNLFSVDGTYVYDGEVQEKSKGNGWYFEINGRWIERPKTITSGWYFVERHKVGDDAKMHQFRSLEYLKEVDDSIRRLAQLTFIEYTTNSLI